MVGTVFGKDEPRARRSDPATSHEAADVNDVEASLGAVLNTLTQYGPYADFELVWEMERLGYPYTEQRIRTARKALTDRGLVEFTGYHHLTTRGRRTQVWQVTE